MSNASPSPAETLLRRQILYRSQHRGLKEADVFLGEFATQFSPHFTLPQLQQFKELLDCPDPDLLSWALRQKPVPPHHNHDIMAKLQDFIQQKLKN